MAEDKNGKRADAQIAETARKIGPKLRVAFSLALLGAVLMSATIKDVAGGRFTEKWVATNGKILTSSIVRVHRMQFPQSVVAHPGFVYSFQVNGQLYESKDDTCDKTDDKSVSELVAKYPEGKEITVHYVLGNPSESYFDHEDSTAHSPIRLGVFIVGLLFLLTAMQLLFRLRRQVKQG